ncbi:MAG: HAD family hydrolase [Candidatus Magasanikbacteria bacterium]|nr:HAD family hydrolase [Candidatus Magasanikbacteria bacterium]
MYDRIVCFDLFDTLVIPLKTSGASYSDVLVRLGVPHDRVYPFVRDHLMTNDLTIEEMVSALFSEFGIDRDRYRMELQEAIDSWGEDNNYQWIVGATELLEELGRVPGLALALISNVTKPGWEAVNRQLSVGERFHTLHLSWKQRVAKPNPRCWLGQMDLLNERTVILSRCWMVGDNQADDLDTPASIGWNTYLAAKDGSNLDGVRKLILGE